MPPKGCHGHSIRGSGYVKPDAKDSTMNDDVQKLLATRALQDAKYFPGGSPPMNPQGATQGTSVRGPTVSTATTATKGSSGKY
jgi:hypothetical protein